MHITYCLREVGRTGFLAKLRGVLYLLLIEKYMSLHPFWYSAPHSISLQLLTGAVHCLAYLSYLSKLAGKGIDVICV